MQVFLKKDIENLGFQYEEINVKSGYARNYLIPKGYADLATPSAKKQIQEILRQRLKKETFLLIQAQELAKKLKNIQIKLIVQVGSRGKLFGSINNQTLSQALLEKGLKVDKKFIFIPGNSIKLLGHYQAKLRLHRQLDVVLPFELLSAEQTAEKK